MQQDSPPPSAHRRLAAILFADIVGFTELSSRDERASLRRVESFEDAVRSACLEHGGTVVKFMGDGALAHFSSTEAAALAALHLRDHFARSTEAAGDPGAQVRAGVHVGDILIRADADVLGEGVNVASRIQSMAKPGEVTVSEEACRQLRHLGPFQFESLGKHTLKGVPEPREIFRMDRAEAQEGVGGPPVEAAQVPPRSDRKWGPPWGQPPGLGRRSLIAMAAVMAVMAASIAVMSNRSLPEDPSSAITSLVVLPFANLSGDPDEAYFVAGMHDALIGELTELGSLRVISRTSAIRYASTDLPLQSIARELNVDAVLAASVIRSEGNVRIRAELIRVFPQEESLWAGTFDREMREVLSLHSEVARALAQAIRLSLTPEEDTRLALTRTVNPEAYEAYMRGRFRWEMHTVPDLDQALAYFEQALSLDPDFAPAQSGVALVWIGRRQLGVAPPEVGSPRARAAAQRALELDPNSSEAHYATAIELGWSQWEWDRAEYHLRRAHELNPGDAQVLIFYSLLLRTMGRNQEAAERLNLGVALDPYNPLVRIFQAGRLAGDGHLDEAVEAYQAILSIWPNHPLALRNFLLPLHLMGRHDEALEVMRAASAGGDAGLLEALERGAAEGGYVGANRAMARYMEERSREEYVPPTGPAMYYLRAGELDDALRWVTRAADDGDYSATYLGGVWYFGLRDHPGYQPLLDRMGVPFVITDEIVARVEGARGGD